jgi:hypothetical protein
LGVVITSPGPRKSSGTKRKEKGKDPNGMGEYGGGASPLAHGVAARSKASRRTPTLILIHLTGNVISTLISEVTRHPREGGIHHLSSQNAMPRCQSSQPLLLANLCKRQRSQQTRFIADDCLFVFDDTVYKRSHDIKRREPRTPLPNETKGKKKKL